jgi:hypothetical protein
MRETGWSLSVAGVKHLRGVDPSKVLLLRAGMRDDNAANNGEILIYSGSLIAQLLSVLAVVVQFT